MSDVDLHDVPPGLLRAGRVVSGTLDAIVAQANPGISTRILAGRAAEVIAALGGVPAMPDCVNAAGTRFDAAACLCVNEEVTHARPSSRRLRPGDVLTIDVAAHVDDVDGRWHADAARSFVVPGAMPGGVRPARGERIAAAAVAAHEACVRAMRAGVTWGACASAACRAATQAGCRLVLACSGHGIGRRLHEETRYGFDEAGGGWDRILRAGDILTVEPVVCEGIESPVLVETHDGWTTLEARGRWTAYRETTVIVTTTGAVRVAG